MIIVSAPAKIHLLGEHTVVHGKPAFLSAIDKRLYVRIKSQAFLSRQGSGVKSNDEVVIESREGDKLVKEAISIFKKEFGIEKLPPIELKIKSQIPTGSGLGSSAAVAVSVLAGLIRYVKKIWNPQRVNKLAFEVEKKAHGNSSGADNTAVCFGGIVWYRREFDFLRSIWSLPTAEYVFPKFCLIDTGKPEESTKQMVKQVEKFMKNNRKKTIEIFTDQEDQTKKLLLAFKNKDLKSAKEAIRKGQENLEKIGVVSSFAKKIVREVESIDGIAKICGAGGKKKGSGMMLCYHQNLEKIAGIAKKHKLQYLPISLGEEGVRIEGN